MRPKTIELASAVVLDRNGYTAAAQVTAAADFQIDGALAAGFDINGLVTAVTPAAAGSMTMNGALITDATHVYLAVPRRLTIVSDADESGIAFQITGKDRAGNVQYETIAGPNTVMVCTEKLWSFVSDIYITGAGTGNIQIGAQGMGTPDIPRHAAVYCGADINAVVFTVYGTNRYDEDISETITGVNTNTVAGLKNFKTIDRIKAGAAVGTNAEIGTVDTFETQWVPLPRESDQTTLAVNLNALANLTYSVHLTLEDIAEEGWDENECGYFDASTDMTDATTDQIGATTGPVRGARVEVTAYLAGGFVANFMPTH